MMPMLVPRRRRGREIMDDPGADPALVVRSLGDVAVANRLFGGARAVVAEIFSVIDGGLTDITLLDVGTGLGDIPRTAAQAAGKRGVRLVSVGFDASEASLRARGDREMGAVAGDARALPFRDSAFDVVMCSQLLHHFPDDRAMDLLEQLDRVAARRVIVSDIRRSWAAAAGIWLASYPLGFHPVSRHDGVVSVMRGYTGRELSALVYSATGVHPRVKSHLGFRLTASWEPSRKCAPCART